ncbi:phosphopantetheine-binding protein [Paraburkholderia phosphatilytica]|uniref:phosphopantetheine-binding protein n=1 Tax=Paraburkholderia phosphatilytica TaxID=2282883 RepID=UPI000E4FA5E2|nr:phosphopantetheine-binding protein [Paraburkholderia phosphatilytica]
MTSSSPAASQDDVATIVRTCLQSVLGEHVRTDLVGDDTSLLDLGIDSMNMTDLLLQLELRLGFTLAPEDLSSDLFLRFDNLVAFAWSRLHHG